MINYDDDDDDDDDDDAWEENQNSKMICDSDLAGQRMAFRERELKIQLHAGKRWYIDTGVPEENEEKITACLDLRTPCLLAVFLIFFSQVLM